MEFTLFVWLMRGSYQSGDILSPFRGTTCFDFMQNERHEFCAQLEITEISGDIGLVQTMI